MKDSYKTVKVLIWPSKKKDSNSVDRDGHVEIAVSGNCYGFLPYQKNITLPARADLAYLRELYKGCKGVMLVRPEVDVAIWYLNRVRSEQADDALGTSGADSLPAVWIFTFKASDESLGKLIKFFADKASEPPLYAYRSDKPNSYNCQTISTEALKVSGIFEDSSFTGVYPDDLLKLLINKWKEGSGPAEARKVHLVPPGFA